MGRDDQTRPFKTQKLTRDKLIIAELMDAFFTKNVLCNLSLH